MNKIKTAAPRVCTVFETLLYDRARHMALDRFFSKGASHFQLTFGSQVITGDPMRLERLYKRQLAKAPRRFK